MDEFRQIEDILMGIDFSDGRKEAVWEKILLRIQLLRQCSDELSLDELDNAAGGLSAIPKPERQAHEKL